MSDNEVTQIKALALPDEQQFRRDIQAINRFQQVVHATMVKDLDYGVIPGTQRPTLLKPGAEKIAKLLGLADQYEIADKSEDWRSPFFRYLIKCRLVHLGTGSVVSEGLGECNSMESKYRYRWLSERDLPPGVDKSKLVAQERRSKTGGHWTMYRFENDDIYSQVNTILKMAKKRALVDAALSAGRLSDVFTQDMEDIPQPTPGDESPPLISPSDGQAPAPEPEVPVAPIMPIATTKRRQDLIDKISKIPSKPQAADIKPSEVTTITALLTICNRVWDMQPPEVYKELNVKSQTEITESPWDCFVRIRGARDVKADRN